MITLFRRLRESLIESGNFRRYLLYAMGEIILVVIGILIALQINNWNENRILKNEINSYLSKKVDQLEEDQEQLTLLINDRLELFESCTDALNKGLMNMPDNKLADLVKKVTLEIRFVSTIARIETDKNTDYYKSIKNAQISDIEADYLNLVGIVGFTEQRLSDFSENLEADLWRGGFLSENRAYFNEFDEDTDIKIEPLILNEDNGLKSLIGIFRRNEIANARIAKQYQELLDVNRELVLAITGYLSE